jgi:hypothetical protein
MAKYVRYNGELFRRVGDEGYSGGGGGPGCLSILLFPFKVLFFIGFVIPIKWPFYTFPRFLKRKCRPLFYLYVLFWILSFVFSILVSVVPSIRDSFIQWSQEQTEGAMRRINELQN